MCNLRVTLLLCTAVVSVLMIPDVFAQTEAPAALPCEPACRSGYTCLQGACVSACNPPCATNETCTAQRECVAKAAPAPVPVPPAVPVAAAAVASPHADATSNININVLGVLQFGPVVAFEFGKQWAGHARVRVANLGVLTYLGFDEEESPGLAFGVGGGFRSYGGELGNLRGFYWGFGAEYLQQNWSSAGGESQTYSGLGIAGDIGYRWVTTSRLYSVGAIGGWVLLLDSDDPEDGDTPFGMFVIEIGWYL